MIPKLNLLKLAIGFPMFLVGCWIATILYPVGYIVGCLFSLFGGYMISRTLKYPPYEMDGIGFALMGLPIFFLSMIPDSYHWLNSIFYFREITLEITRLVMCLSGCMIMFTSIRN